MIRYVDPTGADCKTFEDCMPAPSRLLRHCHTGSRHSSARFYLPRRAPHAALAWKVAGCHRTRQHGRGDWLAIDKAQRYPSTKTSMQSPWPFAIKRTPASNPGHGDGSGGSGSGRHAHTRGLLLVGLFKLSKAVLFASLAVASLHLADHNLGDLVMQVTDKLAVDPEGNFVNLLMDKADRIGAHQLRQFGLAAFCYSVLCLVEGTGLMLEKVWAEYITVILTVIALPWEIYELFERASIFRVGLLLINVAVLLYLLWILKRKREWEARNQSQASGTS